jgi:hypothetical protein
LSSFEALFAISGQYNLMLFELKNIFLSIADTSFVVDNKYFCHKNSLIPGRVNLLVSLIILCELFLFAARNSDYKSKPISLLKYFLSKSIC